MADPLTIIGGIAAIIQISGTVVNLIKTAKDASSDRQKLLAEINATTALCQTLNDYVHINGIEAWAGTLMTLQRDSTGPVEQFKSNLLFLEKKLAKRGFALRWPFAKEEVKEVLESMERQKSFFGIALANDNIRLSKAIQDEVHTVAVGTNAIRAQKQVELKRSILSRLSPIDFETTHADVSSRRAENTGRWLLETSEFKSWMTTPGILWCRGKAGTGKTILSSLIIDTLRHSQKSGSKLGVAGIYCSYRSPQTTNNMMGSILRQLLEPLEELPRSIIDNPSVAAQNPNAAFASISSSSYNRVMLVVDALDECTERIDLLRALRQIPIEIHALIVSRIGIDDIERELRVAGRLEIRSHEEDLRTFLQQNLRQQAYMSWWITETPDFEILVVDSILARSSEMFLLARLYMDLLANLRTKRSVRKALGMLPEGIGNTYSEAWSRICAQNPEQAEIGKKVLSWVVCALRPLRVREVQHAVAVEEGDSESDPEGLLDIGTLTSFCAGLVILDEQSNLLSLVHPTANEYFTAKKLQLFPEAHDMIAVTCCTYLLMDTFRDNGPSLRPDHFVQRCREHPLFGYAVVNWGHHVQVAKSKGSLDVASRLLQDDLARSAAFQALTLNTVGESDFSTEWPDWSIFENEVDDWAMTEFDNSLNSVGALHLAAYFGLLELTVALMEAKSEIDQHDDMGGTAVHWTLIGRQDLFLKKLLELGADASARRTPARTRRWCNTAGFSLPLHIAAYMDNTEAVELLLQKGAGINQDGPTYFNRINALTAAVEGDAHAAANLLLDYGADVNIDSLGLRVVALTASWRTENFDLLKRMTQAGLNKRNLQIALTAAASSCSYDALALLLASGANVNGETIISSPDTRVEGGVSTGTMERTGLEGEIEDHPAEAEEPIAAVLVEAIGNRWEDIEEENVLKCLMLLIDAGADVNAISSSVRGWYGPKHIVDIIGNESMIHGRNTGGRTPLLKAVYFLKQDIVRFLVMKGADINFIHGVGDEQLTALSSALDRESYDDYTMAESIAISSSLLVREMLQLLIELGADTSLCTPKQKNRIEQLLSMSQDNREAMIALQKAALLNNIHYTVSITDLLPFRERREKLKDLVDGGADIELCCDRDKKWIKKFLRWTDAELDEYDRELDELQNAEQARMFTVYNGPLAIRRTNTGGL